MSYLSITDFKFGMDRRRPRSNGVPGTLWLLQNAFISRGGDIERCMKFVPVYAVPGTKGLAEIEGQVFVFGSTTNPGTPVGVQYVQLQAPGGPALVRVLDAKRFDEKLHVVAEFADGTVHQFHGGVRIDDWDAIATANSSLDAVVRRFEILLDGLSGVQAVAYGPQVVLTAGSPGVAFAVSAQATGNDTITVQTTTQARQEASEISATTSILVTAGTPANENRIKSVTADGNELLYAPVVALNTPSATANAVAAAINNATTTHGYAADATGATVVISAPIGDGAGANGRVVAIVTAGDAAATVSGPFAGGANSVQEATQVTLLTFGNGGDAFAPANVWRVTVDGVAKRTSGQAVGTGSGVFVAKQRMFSWADRLLQYSGLNDPTDWTPDDKNSSGGTVTTAIDAGSLYPGVDSIGSKTITAMASYSGRAAIFSPDIIRIYQLSTDAQEIQSDEPIQNTGTISPRSVVQYGNVDVYYLDSSGVRSLRSRETTGEAYASDIGSAIDTYLQDLVSSLPQSDVVDAIAVISPKDGRYLLSLGEQILALSLYPANKIQAWSVLDLGFKVDDMIRTTRDIYVRSGDVIYQYGGPGRNQYPDADEMVVTAETAFVAANDPAGPKKILGIDADCTNVWEVELLIDPANEALRVDGGQVVGPTWRGGKIKVHADTTHVALSLKCREAGPATFSSFALHYKGGQQSG